MRCWLISKSDRVVVKTCCMSTMLYPGLWSSPPTPSWLFCLKMGSNPPVTEHSKCLLDFSTNCAPSMPSRMVSTFSAHSVFCLQNKRRCTCPCSHISRTCVLQQWSAYRVNARGFWDRQAPGYLPNLANATLKGCQCHLAQVWWRKLQTLP